MSTAISFISGKGGSGKTTLVLSIADLLCRCGIETLIVDCDFSTNGATFFYESLLKERQKTNETFLYSLSDIVFTSSMNSIDRSLIKPIAIKPCLSFIPSIAYISNEFQVNAYYFAHNDIYGKSLTDFIQWSKANYDVVLFDCQAGFTDTLYEILPFMDVDLFVLEPDSISASSMRNLYLKIGKQLNSAKVYQVFNKASQEEFDTYSKIVGTFFTNIGTLLFDWKIRQAFSRSQTPDLETVSKQFGYDLCNICKIIITENDMKTAIEKFSLHLSLLQRIEKYDLIEKKLFDLSVDHKKPSFLLSMASLMTAVLGLTTSIISGYKEVLMINSYTFFIIAVAMSIALVLVFFVLNYVSPSSKQPRELRRLYEKQLGELSHEIYKLKKIDPYYDNTELGL